MQNPQALRRAICTTPARCAWCKRLLGTVSLSGNSGCSRRGVKTIPTLIHGLLDYLVALVLFAGPHVLGFASAGGPAVAVPWVAGGLILLLALITAYEPGVCKVLPMRAHLAVDYVLGGCLLLAPWILGLANGPRAVWSLPVVVGGFIVLTAVVSQSATDHIEPQTQLHPR